MGVLASCQDENLVDELLLVLKIQLEVGYIHLARSGVVQGVDRRELISLKDLLAWEGQLSPHPSPLPYHFVAQNCPKFIKFQAPQTGVFGWCTVHGR